MEELNAVIDELDGLRDEYVSAIVTSQVPIEDQLRRLEFGGEINNVLLSQNGVSLHDAMTVGPPGRKGLPYQGDFVVGFYATGKVKFDVYIRDNVVSSYCMCEGEFVYAIDNQMPIVLLCIRFIEGSIKVVEGDIASIEIIYASLKSDTRRFIAQNKFYSKHDNMLYTFGAGTAKVHYDMKEERKNTAVGSEVTDRHYWRPWKPFKDHAYYMNLSKERTSTILKEFSEAAWHPKRFMHWCLPYDELYECMGEMGAPNTYRKLYLGEVIMIDGCFATNIDQILEKNSLIRCGAFNRATYVKGQGMHMHKDHPLQGGEMSFILYLNDVAGGHIVFDDGLKIAPRMGRLLIFGIDKEHYVLPCENTKEIITGECCYKYKVSR